MSSGESGFGLVLAEKFFGLVLVVVGALAAYYTVTSARVLRDYTGFFGFLSIILLALGIVLIVAKTY